MKKLAIFGREDQIFAYDGPINRDNCMAPHRVLQEVMLENGWSCRSFEYFQSCSECPDALLFMEMPFRSLKGILGPWFGKVRCYLFPMEIEAIKPNNWNMDRHNEFDALFTYRTDLVDGKRYIWLNFSQNMEYRPGAGLDGKQKLCTLIAGHKKNVHPKELYSERIRAIRWFENNHENAFDLYGMGWDRAFFHRPKIMRILNRSELLTKMFAPRFPSYRGIVTSKIPVLNIYRFSICFENARDIPGYVTEKIFDSIMAGCIPIYWGAPDIKNFVPEDCFIDFTAFRNYEELYAYMVGISDNEFQGYLDRFERYIAKASIPPYNPFSSAYFAATIREKIIADAS